MAIDSKNLLVAVKAYARGNGIPLDSSEVHGSLEEAQQYAKSATAYAGQTIKVLQNGKYETYVLNGSKGAYTLDKIGVDQGQLKNYVQVVDSLPLKNQEQGVVYINTTDKKGYIWTGSWTEIFEQVDGLGTTIQALNQKIGTLETTLVNKADRGTTLAEYGIADSMTAEQIKAEINTAIGKAEHLKRIIVSQLPEVGVADANAIYMVSKDQGAQQKYEEFMVINNAWEKIGDSAVDLSGYSTTEQMNQAIGTAKQQAIDVGAADATTKADKAKNDAIADITPKIEAAKQEAISAAALDAQSKADAAQSEAIKQSKAYTDEKDAATQLSIKTIQTNLNTKVTADDVKSQINTRLGNKIPETKTVADYVDEVVGAGGTSNAEAIEKAKNEAIQTSKAYTDSALTIIEF